jgi:outer membrane protein assembly factor BamB
VTGQPLVARGVPRPGASTVYVATTAGRVYAFAPNGYLRWERDLGQLERPCPQLDGWGVTGTPAIDPASKALYAADAFGRLHALDLATGAELAGWPVRIYDDDWQDHVFGALTILDGAVYVPTAAYCDNPMEGKVIRVSIATRETTRWIAVPFRLGGGGGMWGFGGLAYSAARDAIYAATGNAFKGGENVGSRYREWAGYGEQLVELSRDLEVRAASHPTEIDQSLDLDFGSAPVLVTRHGCPELVVAVNKNGTMYAWRTDGVDAGPAWSVRVSRAKIESPLITQPAWSPRHSSLYLGVGGQYFRILVGSDCRPHRSWTIRLRPAYIQGAPTVARDTVWFSGAGTLEGLLGVDALTGRVTVRARLAGDAYAAPTVVDRSLFVATFAGGLHGFLPRGVPIGRSLSDVPGHVSFLDRAHGWVARESGVYSTDDAGLTWRKIFAYPAIRIVRTGLRSGVVETGSPASRCHCRARFLWTRDGGRFWRDSGLRATLVAGRGRLLYAARGGALHQVRWPPAATRGLLGMQRVGGADHGAIVDLAPVPGGVVGLLSDRVHGHGWDGEPRILVHRLGSSRLVSLPPVDGMVLVHTLMAAWPALTVRGTDYDTVTRGVAELTWRSPDGGATWTVLRSG